jgi:hypothetical protein
MHQRARRSAQPLERTVHPVAVIAIVAVALAFYLALLATWSIAHDPTLSRSGRITRLVIVWLAPIAAPVLILRAAAEFAPESLPVSFLLRPVRWLLRVRPRPSGPGFESYVPGEGPSSDHTPGGH